jgi:hypothetical protein
MTATAPRSGLLRRALRALSTVMIVAGLILLADAGLTLVWQEPVSAFYAQVQQGRLDDELQELEETPLAPHEERALRKIPNPTRRLAFRARALDRRLEPGDPMGRIVMPATCAPGPATIPRRRSRASAARSRSPGTARRTGRRSATSTSSTAATRSSCGCRTAASSTASSGPVSLSPRRPR